MKRIFDSPMTQTERSRRYREKNNIVLLSARIEKSLVDKLVYKLQVDRKNKADFLREAIKRYLEGHWFDQNRP